MADVLQLHRLGRETTPEEIMRALHEDDSSSAARTTTKAAAGDADYEKSVREQTNAKTRAWFASANWEIVDAVERVAADKGAQMAHVATSWVLHQWVLAHLRVEESVVALYVRLTSEVLMFLKQGYRPRSLEGM
ncbi:uncharacterized protein E0L32_000130 [Thyridium curvatum]|uniref:Uncharacterized protein n=1 Tax=Thyridium curvatum TaxID=1093900 RepID=A0A507B9F7_9PEZI|nr:uncharacterized protein E0L32_000130 [Thyridium curvatum]TPX15796.1 hypothetical protein E0L32_000130 [Thyridium curvatum]